MMRVYDETCLALCEGQYLDISFERRADITVEAYMEMIAKKTAALLGASVRAGAILASDDDAVGDAYEEFGQALGMAFQMADDMKGTFWASAESGKAEAGDVRKRKKTLPVVWALEHASEAESARLTEIYLDGVRATDGRGPSPIAAAPISDADVAEVLEILERSGAREHTRASPGATGIARSSCSKGSPARPTGSATSPPREGGDPGLRSAWPNLVGGSEPEALARARRRVRSIRSPLSVTDRRVAVPRCRRSSADVAGRKPRPEPVRLGHEVTDLFGAATDRVGALHPIRRR